MLRCKYVKNSSGERKIMQIEFKEKREQMVINDELYAICNLTDG